MSSNISANHGAGNESLLLYISGNKHHKRNKIYKEFAYLDAPRIIQYIVDTIRIMGRKNMKE
jgi:hypothetical protein